MNSGQQCACDHDRGMPFGPHDVEKRIDEKTRAPRRCFQTLAGTGALAAEAAA